MLIVTVHVLSTCRYVNNNDIYKYVYSYIRVCVHLPTTQNDRQDPWGPFPAPRLRNYLQKAGLILTRKRVTEAHD